MAGPEILRKIVVKVSSDKRNLRGTGFFATDREIVTCHHVLADGNGSISEGQRYFVKNDDWADWIEAQPIEERCGAAQDFAFLSPLVPIRLEAKSVPFKRWDGRHKEFFTRGYDCNTSEDEGASSLEGEDCQIVDKSSRGKEPRWQLSTIKRSLLPGRSGSPVWSVGQKAIVGMIDYQAGDESILKERSLAIPIEEIFPDLPQEKVQPVNAPSLPQDFLPRPEDLARLKELVLSHGEDKSAITGRTGVGCQPPNARVGLQGMGGIGKSVLAAALAWDDQVLEAFPDGVIWISLGQQPNLPNRQLQLLQFLDKDHRAIKDEEDGKGCLKQLLSGLSCLIILDDVWSMESVRAFDALAPDCRMLVTTRDREIVRGMKAKELCLDVLDEEKSLQLLALSSGLKLEDLDPKAREVAEECDHLPLALAMVGSMARAALERGRSDPWEHILHRLRTADLEKIKAEFPDYPYPNLLRAIEVSLDSLEPEEQRRYLNLAIFPEDTEVPEAVLGLLWGLDEYDTRDLAAQLADRSLASLSSGRLGQHDLQHDFAVKRAGDLPALHSRLVEAYRKEGLDGWHTGPDDGYFFSHLAYHLLHSGRKEELKMLLLDYRWLQARLEKTDITSLISDFDLLPEDEELGLLQHCLRLSSHVLFKDSSELAGQLLGRMQGIDLPGIRELMQQASAFEGCPWLRPITSSFTCPGGPLIRSLVGHANTVNAVALTADGRWAVSASDDWTLKIWDIESGKLIKTMEGHDGAVSAVALTPDGRTAVSASDDCTLKVWDPESGREMRTLKGHAKGVFAVALTPDGRTAVSASDDCTLKVWDLKSGREMRTLKGHAKGVFAVALTPDGRTAVSASDDCALKVWDLKSGREMRTLKGHAKGVFAVVLTPDGRTAVSASDDCTLKVWDLKSGREMRTLEGHADIVRSVVLTPDGRTAVSASYDSTLKVWDLKSAREIQNLVDHGSAVIAIAVAFDGRTIVSGSLDNTLKVWDLERGMGMRTWEGHSDSVSAIAITSDGRTAVSASYDCTLKVWDLKSGREMRTLEGHANIITAIALSSSGRTAVSASHDCTLKVWDLKRGREMKTLKGHASIVRDVALTPNGRTAVSASNDRTLKVWDLKRGWEMQTLAGHASYISAFTLSPDGRTAVSASADCTLKVWDLKSGREMRTLEGHGKSVFAVALTPDGRTAVSASDDCTLKVWDLESGSEMRTLEGHASGVSVVANTPDGRTAVSASWDGTLRVWDLKSGREMQALAVHTVRGEVDWDDVVTLSNDGRIVVSASDYNTLKVLEIESGSMIASFTGDSSITSCAISPDGRTIVVGEASGRVHFLRLEGLPEGEDDKHQDTREHADYSIALKRSNDKNDAVLSESEMREHLNSSD